MALIKCTECGSEISDQAVSCPKCGAPNRSAAVPKVNATPVQLKKKQKPKTGIWAWIVIVLLIAFFAWVFLSPEDPTTQTAQSSNVSVPAHVTTPPPTQAVSKIEISAQQLYEEYSANEVLADTHYRGKILIVSGTVQSINKDFEDDPYISLSSGSDDGISSIQAKFSENDISTLAKLHKGQDITITCIGAGKTFMSPVLDCRK